ncbi:efflux RND transporter periplasmic adaptor subunit [Hydrocarboniphaga sp.]|uniref:efflux RND transporter periplasmic adaptor subunit n=1 Tax=Hydrocarboniphaga sp. TaxID=2033016 RepID=UPI003D122818
MNFVARVKPGVVLRWKISRVSPGLLLLLCVYVGAQAHNGEDHGGGAVAAPAAVVTVSKNLQHELAITTTRVGDARAATALQLTGEVLQRPESNWRVQAPEAGRLLAVGGGWPVAGQSIAANQLLAVLEPALSQRERARREVDLASLKQKISIAQINVDRLRLQQRASGIGAEGNTYVEGAFAEYETLQRQIELAQQGLSGRVEIRAGEAGRLQRAPVSAGEVVARGQALFELAGARPRLAVRVYDPRYTRGAIVASATVDARTYPLHAVGYSAASPEPGWTLLLDFDAQAPSLAPGALAEVSLNAAPKQAIATSLSLPRASVQGTSDAAWVWVHQAPEQFVRRSVQIVDTQRDTVWVAQAALAADERIAVQGAALLDQFRR